MKRKLPDAIASALALIPAKAGSDYMYTASAQAVGFLTSFLTALLVTNRLGLEQLGAYTLIVSIATFIAALAEVGIGQTATRYASIASTNSDSAKCNEVVAWSINVRVVFALASLLVGLLFAEWLGIRVWNSGTAKDFMAHTFVLGAVITLQQCANAHFYTHHNFRFISLTVLLNSVLILGSVLVLDNLGVLTLRTLVFVSIVASLVVFSLVCVVAPWRRIYDLRERRRPLLLTLQLRASETTVAPADAAYGIKPQAFAFYLLASSLIVTVFTRLDVWMIGALMTEADLGKYKLASYFALPLSLAVGALNITLWPRASRLVSKDSILAYIRKTLMISLFFVSLSTVYVVALNWIPALVFPAHGAAITGLAMVLCLRYALAMLIAPVAIAGYSLGMSQLYVVVNFLQLLTVFMANFYLMDSLGIYAPALALIATEFISIVIIGPALRSRVRTLAHAPA